MQTRGLPCLLCSFSVFSSENSFLPWGPSPTTELSCFSQCLSVLKMSTVFLWNEKKRKEQKKELLCLFLRWWWWVVVNICIFKKSPLLFSSVLHNTNCKQGRVPMLKVISIKIPWAFQGRQRNQPQAIVLGSAQLTWKASRGTSNFSVNNPGSHP